MSSVVVVIGEVVLLEVTRRVGCMYIVDEGRVNGKYKNNRRGLNGDQLRMSTRQRGTGTNRGRMDVLSMRWDIVVRDDAVELDPFSYEWGWGWCAEGLTVPGLL